MRIDEAIASATEPCFSFEFFPPKSQEGEQNLYEALEALRALEPTFVSVTWGAGGSTREKTIEIVTRIRDRHNLEAMAHLTCVGATVKELRACVGQMHDAGVQNVLALRGDPPQGVGEFVATPGGLSHGSELAALVGANHDLCIAGACYPECHPESDDMASELATLRLKIDAGVTVLISQLFFDNDAYFRFVGAARAAGIDVAIVPGIMPITNVAQIKRFTSMCGATLPAALVEQLELIGDRPEAVVEFGVAYATMQCAQLLANGAPGIHFYTLNRSLSTRAILAALQAMRPWETGRPFAERSGPAA